MQDSNDELGKNKKVFSLVQKFISQGNRATANLAH